MGCRAKTRVDVLDGIAATLLALADLAERQAGRYHPLRSLVLWALWQADQIAREFVAGSAWNPAGRHWSPALIAIRYGTDPADAMDLAVSLRALARIVRSMEVQGRRLSVLHAAHAAEAGHGGTSDCDRTGRALQRLLAITQACALFRMAALDTS